MDMEASSQFRFLVSHALRVKVVALWGKEGGAAKQQRAPKSLTDDCTKLAIPIDTIGRRLVVLAFLYLLWYPCLKTKFLTILLSQI